MLDDLQATSWEGYEAETRIEDDKEAVLNYMQIFHKIIKKMGDFLEKMENLKRNIDETVSKEEMIKDNMLATQK